MDGMHGNFSPSVGVRPLSSVCSRYSFFCTELFIRSPSLLWNRHSPYLFISPACDCERKWYNTVVFYGYFHLNILEYKILVDQMLLILLKLMNNRPILQVGRQIGSCAAN